MRSIHSLLRSRPRRLPGRPSCPRLAIATSQLQDHEDFFQYTSGRWLWDEHARLEERYRRFDVTALQAIAASSVGAGRCVSMQKLAEGGSNKIFRLVMDNDTTVIARIPTLNAGPLSQAIASEVATMDFASRILGIPVPQVISWSTKADNPVQSEYILMEEASGVQLGSLWSSIDVDAKAELVEQLASITNKLLSLSFSHYGSIYFLADTFPGCKPARVHGSCAQNVRTEVRSRYVIGPVVGRSFWDGEREKLSTLRGPWVKPQDYLSAIAEREVTWLRNYADLQEKTRLPFQSPTQTSPEEHIAMYQRFWAASGQLLPSKPALVRSTLWHWDLHAPNIFVTGNKITSIIDWQDCWAGPLVLQAQRPRLVDFQGELTLQLPPRYQSLEEGPEKQHIRSNVEKSLLLFTYESEVQRENPVLEQIFHLPQGSTIRDTVLFASNTWDGGITPFRQCLIRLFRNWKQIHPNQDCPFTFTQKEIDCYMRQDENWNDNADFWSSLSGLVGRDGFVLKEDYDEALEIFAKLREDGLQTLESDERVEFDQATTWAARKRDEARQSSTVAIHRTCSV